MSDAYSTEFVSRRSRRLAEVCELVTQVMSLRPPQADALREFTRLLTKLPRKLCDCNEADVRSFLTEAGRFDHSAHANFTFALATGVGKTRLAGALIALLFLTGESRTFLILAPRRAVLRRFDDAMDTRFHEYLFVDPGLVPDPYVITTDQIDDPAAVEATPDAFKAGPTIYLLSPQLISTSDRFRKESAFTGKSPAAHLAQKDDLVVIVDEAHHVGGLGRAEAAKWGQAIRELKPQIQLGLTATPRGEEGENCVYVYSLAQALSQKLYTKDVHLLVRNFAGANVSDEDIDSATISYALSRLAEKELAARSFDVEPFPDVKPVCVFFARDISHAEAVVDVLHEVHGLRQEEVLLTHSKSSKSEDELEKLLSIEDVENPVKVVVNVQELTEGWDVKNVYVVAPLRAMATFQGALQSMGRGLRLPAGRRVDDTVLDSLDVVCFGKASLQGIVEEATSWYGKTPSTSTGGITIDDFDVDPPNAVDLLIPVVNVPTAIELRDLTLEHSEVDLKIPPEAIRSSVRMTVDDLELAKLRSRLDSRNSVSLSRESFVLSAALRALRVASRHLADDQHMEAVQNIVASWLQQAQPDAELIEFDPNAVGEEVGRLVVKAAQSQTASYQTLESVTNISFAEFAVRIVKESPQPEQDANVSISDIPLASRESFVPRTVYTGAMGTRWNHGVHPAYAFDSFPEVQLAWLLDHSDDIKWWCRNEPKRLRIPTPLGYHSPDFLCQSDDGTLMLIEVKGDHFWEPADSEPRLKADAAREWAAMQTSLGPNPVTYLVALESDINSASSLDGLIASKTAK